MGTTGMGTRKLDAVTNGDPLLRIVDGIVPRTIVISHFPFTVGRRTDRDLVIPEPRVSREHAQFVRELDGIYLVDQASEHGTYVNGERVARCKLTCNDRAEFGSR
jgi:pSer/pThr/pTyr-binding forkhead associated (FHA) protein